MTSQQNTFLQKNVELQAFDAIQLHHFTRVQYFLKNGLDPNLWDDQQRTLLMSACSLVNEKNALKFSNLLLKYKATIELSDKNGLNALHYAVLNEHENLVGRLLEFSGNFDVNMQDNEGNSALMLAVFTKNYDIVKKLVQVLRKYDLSVDVGNNQGISPLILASLLHENDIAQYLIDDGKASTQIRDKHFRKSAKDWQEIDDLSMYHDVLKESSIYVTIGTPSITRNHPTSRQVPKELSIKNPTLKRAILRNPSQYINYPSYITSESLPRQSTSKQTEGIYRYPDLKPVYNMYEQELSSSYRKSIPPRAKTPPPPRSEISSDGQRSWRKTLLSLKLKQRRHTIALTRSLPNIVSTKNLFQRHGFPVVGTQARSYSLGTSEAILDSSKWTALRQSHTRRNSFGLPYGTSLPSTAPGGMESNSRRSSTCRDLQKNVQRRRSVNFQLLITADNDHETPPQSPGTHRSSLKYSDTTQPPIPEEEIV